MSFLHLGVIDVPYQGTNEHDKNSKETTGDVALSLEFKYKVMQIFFEEYEDEITEILEKSFEAQIDQFVFTGQFNLSEIDTSKIDDLFKQYLSNNEWESATGERIGAASLGHSKRFKDRYNEEGKRGPRPAFIDSGLYQASFKSWVDNRAT
jgi:hypothetical protein